MYSYSSCAFLGWNSWTKCIQGEVCHEFSELTLNSNRKYQSNYCTHINGPLISNLACNCCCQIQLLSAQVSSPGGSRAVPCYRVRKWESSFWNFLKVLLINWSTLKYENYKITFKNFFYFDLNKSDSNKRITKEDLKVHWV